MTDLCGDCIYAMASFVRNGSCTPYYYCAKIGGYISHPHELVRCKYRQTEGDDK